MVLVFDGFVPVSEWGHHEPLLGTQILELIVEIDISNGNHAGAIIVDVIRRVWSPVEARLSATGAGGVYRS